ncbi:MAG: alpha-hydroxy acid oxidase [Pseudomonadota bacterium]
MNDPFSIRDRAQKRLPRMIFDFVDGGTGADTAQSEIIEAFNAIKLQPRILKNVEQLDLTKQLMGRTYERPFGFAPMGMCNLIATHADSSMSLEAAQRQIPHCVSTAASTTLEQSFQQSAGNCWFQLYAGTNHEFTQELLKRASNSGFETLVFTVDTPRNSRRTRDLKNGFTVPITWGPRQLMDFASHPIWSINLLRSGIPEPMNYKTSQAQNLFDRFDSRAAADWDYLRRLRDSWTGHLVVKGVTCVEDALGVEEAGCDAIYVSNHGGRQLDSTAPAISVLRDIAQERRTSIPVIFDSGIRSADDVLRALALGADFVMLGRPVLFALAAGGSRSLANFLNRLEDDLKSAMAQLGITRISQIDDQVIAGRGGDQGER